MQERTLPLQEVVGVAEEFTLQVILVEMGAAGAIPVVLEQTEITQDRMEEEQPPARSEQVEPEPARMEPLAILPLEVPMVVEGVEAISAPVSIRVVAEEAVVTTAPAAPETETTPLAVVAEATATFQAARGSHTPLATRPGMAM
jgi:hypothetical protein